MADTVGGDRVEAQIRQQIDGWAASFRAKDIDGVMACYAPDVVSFDIVPPLQYVGAAAYRRAWEEGLAPFRGPIDYEVHDLRVTTGDGVAFSHSLNRMRSTLQDGQQTELWLRWTACFRRIDGAWLIAHEQVSVPVDLASGRALLDLKP
jgi:uncharacterized protein (TIGR02246 family)